MRGRRVLADSISASGSERSFSARSAPGRSIAPPVQTEPTVYGPVYGSPAQGSFGRPVSMNKSQSLNRSNSRSSYSSDRESSRSSRSKQSKQSEQSKQSNQSERSKCSSTQSDPELKEFWNTWQAAHASQVLQRGQQMYPFDLRPIHVRAYDKNESYDKLMETEVQWVRRLNGLDKVWGYRGKASGRQYETESHDVRMIQYVTDPLFRNLYQMQPGSSTRHILYGDSGFMIRRFPEVVEQYQTDSAYRVRSTAMLKAFMTDLSKAGYIPLLYELATEQQHPNSMPIVCMIICARALICFHREYAELAGLHGLMYLAAQAHWDRHIRKGMSEFVVNPC